MTLVTVAPVAVAVMFLSSVIAMILHRRRHRHQHQQKPAPISADTQMPSDPVTRALAELTTDITGAPTTSLAAHPETRTAHIRDRHRPAPEPAAAPVARIELPTTGLPDIPLTPLPSAPVVGLATPAPALNAKAVKHAYKHQRVDVLLAAAHTTYDPSEHAALTALAAAAARSGHHDSADRLTLLCADISTLIDNNPHLAPYTRTLSYTTTVTGTPITIPLSVDSLAVAAADVHLRSKHTQQAEDTLTHVTHPGAVIIKNHVASLATAR